ncbi:hypothetical protein [Pseudomonas sp. RGM2987]|nr:hypothetical protein [Pseudomonas sp. RGM2987]MCJ8206451.1 hypothetical protein [Pseudomonas sp. RGM2987]
MLMSLAINTKKSHLQERKTKAAMISEPSSPEYFLFLKYRRGADLSGVT